MVNNRSFLIDLWVWGRGTLSTGFVLGSNFNLPAAGRWEVRGVKPVNPSIEEHIIGGGNVRVSTPSGAQTHTLIPQAERSCQHQANIWSDLGDQRAPSPISSTRLTPLRVSCGAQSEWTRPSSRKPVSRPGFKDPVGFGAETQTLSVCSGCDGS